MSNANPNNAPTAGAVKPEIIHVDHQEPASRPKQARNQWPKITKHIKEDGKMVTKYPFLSMKDNHMDAVVVRNLLVDKPYLAPHGETTTKWTNAADNISKEEHPTNGGLLFFPPVTAANLKIRFDAYMAFAKKYDCEVPYNTGGDDEESPGEIQQGIEDMYEEYTSFLATKDDSKKSVMASQKSEKAAAEIIRRASLGHKPTDEELAETPAAMHGRDKKSSKSSGSSGNSMRPSAGTVESLTSLQDALVSRNQATAQKQENKKRRLEIYEKKLELDKQRLEAEIEKENKRHEAEKERREMEAKNAEAMRTFMLAMAAKIGK